jgi:thymidylate synthase ThyX
MSFAAKIHEDSRSPDGVRLTTMEVTFPRPILAEFNTHRMFSRNSASSRAIPVKEMIRRVHEDPYVPTHWGKNQKGMQAEQEVSAEDAERAKKFWLQACDLAVVSATALSEKVGIHKQITNRLLEPFMWQTVIVTATEWDNFFHLRDNPQAHPEIQKIAHMMRELYEAEEPIELRYGEWHTPLVDIDTSAEVFARFHAGTDTDPHKTLCKISVARCARVSYLTHDGKRDIQADLDLHDKLLASGHLSPFEHVARPAANDDLFRGRVVRPSNGGPATLRDYFSGNLRGWVPYRKLIPNEADIFGVKP